MKFDAGGDGDDVEKVRGLNRKWVKKD